MSRRFYINENREMFYLKNESDVFILYSVAIDSRKRVGFGLENTGFLSNTSSTTSIMNSYCTWKQHSFTAVVISDVVN